jgi:HlyD family secretion protein
MSMSADMDRQIPATARQRRRFAIAGAAVLAVALIVLVALSVVRSLSVRSIRVPLATVRIDTVQRGVFHDVTPLTGRITPRDTIDLDALEGGQVAQVLAQAGDKVAANQPLAVFRNTGLELDVLDREGRLIESITELQTYEKQLEDTRLANEKALAEIDYNLVRLARASGRRAGLATIGAISTESLDQIQDELAYERRLQPLQAQSNSRQEALRVRQLPQIHAQTQSLQQSLSITRAKLDDLTVRAPVAGRLTDFDLNVGQNFNRGDRLGVIVPPTGFKVSADVDQFYLDRVRVGQTAKVLVHDQTRALRVTRVYPRVKDGVFVTDLAFVGNPPPGLLPGETVTGRLALGGDQPALVLPAGPFLERTGGDWAMVLTGDHRAVRRTVRLGRRNSEQVEVLSGLTAGDRVITSDYSAFEKVDQVNLTN